MMDIDFKRYRNPSPETEDFDFETAPVKRRHIFTTAFGVPCQYMNLMDENDFRTPVGSEDSSSSSDESTVVKKSPPKVNEVVEKESLPSCSSNSKPVKKEPLSDEEDTHRRRKREKRSRWDDSKSKRWTGVEYSDSDSEYTWEERKLKHKPKQEQKPVKNEEPEEKKHVPGITFGLGDFFCHVCGIMMNSEVTMNTHVLGKKHLKALKANDIPEVAMQSLSLMSSEPQSSRTDRRYPTAAPGMKYVKTDKISHIQSVADDYQKGPLPGLSSVVEFRAAERRETTYYCNLCDAPCSSSSIMCHLTGFKHQLRCLEIIDRNFYERHSHTPKKLIEDKVLRILSDHERRNKRGIIEVQEEVADDSFAARADQPGPSWRYDGPSCEPFSREDTNDAPISSAEDLDVSQNDFRCIICDSHMNNKSMWEAHVRGKRHLKNKKKCPGESSSKIKSYPCLSETAHLMDNLRDVVEPVVGLEFIRETQGEAGDLYNCFLCGACTSNYDIIEHLLTTKHRIKYLETIHKRGKINSIESIKLIYDVSSFQKDSMVEEECRQVLKKYGSGKVDVYKSKNVYPQSFYGSLR